MSLKKNSNTQISFKIAILLLTIISFFGVSNIQGFPNFSINDTFELFSWSRKVGDNLNYGYKLQANSFSQVKRNDSMFVNSIVSADKLPEWMDKGSFLITFTGFKPLEAINCSPAYKNSPWVTGFQLDINQQRHSIKFFFPVPDQKNPYKKYDFFIIALNDSIQLQFQGVHDSLFMGSLLNNKKLKEPENWLLAKAAVLVRTSNNSPFKIQNIQFDAKYKKYLQSYIGIDFSKLQSNDKSDYYGIDFIGKPSTEQNFKVKDIEIQGGKTLIEGSTQKIVWTTEGKDAIKVCSLYVSFNQDDSQWFPIGKTTGSKEEYIWSVPENGKKLCSIQIRAIGFDGQNNNLISDVYQIILKFRLRAILLNNSSVKLEWDPNSLEKTNSTSFMIAYSPKRLILADPYSTSDTTHYDFKTNSDTVFKLIPENLYYFAAFLCKNINGIISNEFIGFDSAVMKDLIPPENNFHLSAAADSSRIYLNWESVSAIPQDAESIGIFVCNFRYPIEFNDKDASHIKNFPATNLSCTLSDFQSGQTFFFSLMVKDPQNNWSKPTMQSMAKVHLGKITETSVIELTSNDTLRFLNDSLIIWITSDLPLNDTIEKWEGSVSEGFVKASSGFILRKGDQLIWIRLPYSNKLNSKLATQILLYSFDIHDGKWMLCSDSVKIDTIACTATAKNTSPGLPFMFLIDTLPPQITLLRKNNAPVEPLKLIKDTICIKDNIKNYNIEFLAGSGDEELWNQVMYISPIDTDNTPQLLSITYQPEIISGNTGFRSVITVSDKTNKKTLNISRPVIREINEIDNITLDSLKWTPLTISARPNHPELWSVMKSSTGETNWKYIKSEMRIIKWVPGHSSSFDGGWVEYSTAEDSLFTLIPGTYFWIRAKKQINIDYGQAIIPPLSDTQSVTFSPNQWHDFSNLFPFDIYIGDILEASEQITNTNSADLLEIYSWQGSNGVYQTNQLYLHAMPGLNNSDDTIKLKKPYAIYNPNNQPVTIHIPPVCVSASSISKKTKVLSKKGNNTNQWSFRIDAWCNSNSLPPVYCGYDPLLSKDLVYGIPPSFAEQRIFIYDSKEKKKWGNIVSSNKSKDGTYYELLFENNASSPSSILALVGKTFGLDQSCPIKWYDSERSTWINAIDTIKVVLNAHQNKIQIIAIGNEQFFRELESNIRRNVLALHSVYHNPFNRSIMVRFSLPNNALKVSFSIYSMTGQVLWNKNLANLNPGSSFLKMDKKLAAGVYLFQMRVVLKGSTTPKLFNKPITCIR